MDAQHVQLNIPLSFNQVIDIVKQLSPAKNNNSVAFYGMKLKKEI